MLDLLLVRYGLKDKSLSTILNLEQEDGLQPRTLKLLKSLGLADENFGQGCQMGQVDGSRVLVKAALH